MKALALVWFLGAMPLLSAKAEEAENILVVERTSQTPPVLDLKAWPVYVNRIDSHWSGAFECSSSYESMPPSSCLIEERSTDRRERLNLQLRFVLGTELPPGEVEAVEIRFSNDEHDPAQDHGYIDLSVRSSRGLNRSRGLCHVPVFYRALNVIEVR